MEVGLANSLSSDQLQELARHGAKARLEELRTEIAAIQGFLAGAEISRVRRGRRARSADATPTDQEVSAQTAGGRRKRRGMSAAARAAVSARMKKYWADRRRSRAKK